MDKAKAASFNSTRLTVSPVLHFWHDCANAGTPYNRPESRFGVNTKFYSYTLSPTSSTSKHVRCNITYEFLSLAWEGQQQVKDTRRGMHRQQLFSEATLSISHFNKPNVTEFKWTLHADLHASKIVYEITILCTLYNKTNILKNV